MKQYVSEFAHDLISSYRSNDLMHDDMRNKKANKIEYILSDYNNGFITSTEAVYLISRIALGY